MEAADRTIHADPYFIQTDHDGVKNELFRHQIIGKYRGLGHLFHMLDERKRDLEERVAQQKKQLT